MLPVKVSLGASGEESLGVHTVTVDFGHVGDTQDLALLDYLGVAAHMHLGILKILHCDLTTSAAVQRVSSSKTY